MVLKPKNSQNGKIEILSKKKIRFKKLSIFNSFSQKNSPLFNIIKKPKFIILNQNKKYQNFKI